MPCPHWSLLKERGVYYSEVESEKWSRAVRVALSVLKPVVAKG